MKYILYGAGKYGKKAIEFLGKENIKFFLDSNVDKSGTQLDGIDIYYFFNALQYIGNTMVVITVAPDIEDSIQEILVCYNIKQFIKFSELSKSIIYKRINERPNFINIYNRAINWIQKNSIDNEGIICHTNKNKAYPEVTGYYIPTLLRWGYRKLAVSYTKWLCEMQEEDGSWYDVDNKEPYIFDTAQILKGLLAIREIYPQVDSNIRKGCDWILSNMQSDGRLPSPRENDFGTGDTFDEIIHLYCLSPLIEAGYILNIPDYKEKAYKIFGYYKKNKLEKILNFNMLSHFYAYVIEALIDLGEEELARNAMNNIKHYQNTKGMVPAYNDCNWVCSTGLFQLSLIWFRLGDLEYGNKTFEYACKLQNPTGGWFGSYLDEESPNEINTYFPNSEISWAVKYFLDALYFKNVAEFEACSNIFLNKIDVRDGRYQKIMNEVRDTKQKLGRILNILDLGCGKGRYIKNLKEVFPENLYYAVDISCHVMREIDGDQIQKKQGTLTCVPYRDNFFDITYSCEALEHAVDINSAVREMVRVTKKGGKIIIIDKNLEQLGRMDISPWEQWFDVEKLTEVMSQYCERVSVCKEISYDNKKSDGLFCAWVGEVNK